MSYWFNQQLDMNLEEVALIAYKKQYSAHSLLQTPHKLPVRKSPALGFAPCSLLKFWSPLPKILSIQQNPQETQKLSCTTASEHRKHILGQRMQSDPRNSALLTLSSAKRRFPPVHPRPTDPPLNISETATVNFF